jgi:plasmid stabilization system protein ParE
LVVSAVAAADIERLHAFLARNNPAAARHAAKLLIDTVQSLGTLPERGRPSGTSNIRELIIPFGRSAYVLRYSYSAHADEVVVHRIWHGRETRE